MGIFEAAVAGGAGLFAYKKIHKSSNEKKRKLQNEQSNQQPPHKEQPYVSSQIASDHDHDLSDNPKDMNTTSGTRNSNPSYHSSTNTTHTPSNGYGYGYGYSYQPQPLAFQPASEKFRGQHLRIDTENINGHHYTTHRARQELYYLEACMTNPTAASGSSLHRFSGPQRPRHQSSFVEDLDDPVSSQYKERAQCYYI